MHWIKEITQLVLSLVQLVAALTLIGLIIEPQLADGNRAIHGRPITLEGTVIDRQGNPVPDVTVMVVRNDGTPYKDGDGNPARSVTDRNGRYKLKATVKGTYLELVLPQQN